MAAINPYLNFNGNTEDAFNFYKTVFGGEFQSLMRWSDNPDCAEWAETDKQKTNAHRIADRKQCPDGHRRA